MLHLLRHWKANGRCHMTTSTTGSNRATQHQFCYISLCCALSVEDLDDCGRHPLHYAAARGQTEFVRELLLVGRRNNLNTKHLLDSKWIHQYFRFDVTSFDWKEVCSSFSFSRSFVGTSSKFGPRSRLSSSQSSTRRFSTRIFWTCWAVCGKAQSQFNATRCMGFWPLLISFDRTTFSHCKDNNECVIVHPSKYSQLGHPPTWLFISMSMCANTNGDFAVYFPSHIFITISIHRSSQVRYRWFFFVRTLVRLQCWKNSWKNKASRSPVTPQRVMNLWKQ